MNGDGTRDLVVADSFNPGTGYKLYYYYGTLSTSRTVSAWNNGASNGSINLTNEDVGISMPYSVLG